MAKKKTRNAEQLDCFDWTGKTMVRLDEGRYYVVIGALCDGQHAIFDASTSELLPFEEK